MLEPDRAPVRYAVMSVYRPDGAAQHVGEERYALHAGDDLEMHFGSGPHGLYRLQQRAIAAHVDERNLPAGSQRRPDVVGRLRQSRARFVPAVGYRTRHARFPTLN